MASASDVPVEGNAYSYREAGILLSPQLVEFRQVILNAFGPPAACVP
jgi:hypothetical protein